MSGCGQGHEPLRGLMEEPLAQVSRKAEVEMRIVQSIHIIKTTSRKWNLVYDGPKYRSELYTRYVAHRREGGGEGGAVPSQAPLKIASDSGEGLGKLVCNYGQFKCVSSNSDSG